MTRRVANGAVTTVLLFFFIIAFFLVARVTGQRLDPAQRQIDPAAVAILEAMDRAFMTASGLVATYRSESFRPTGQPLMVETTTLKLGRPNVYEVRTKMGSAASAAAGRERILASNGKNRFDVSGTRCLVSDVAPLNDAREVDTFNPVYWSFYDLGEWQIRSALLGHWSTKWRLADPGLRSVRYIGRESLNGQPVDVIEWAYTVSYNRPDDDPIYTSRLSIGLDRFVRRIETTSTSRKEYEGRRIVETITEIRAVAPFDRAEFAYQPPAGLTCTPTDPESVYTTGQYVDLPIGSKAPDFTLKTARGETLQFSAFLKRHKVVLMNYWGYG
jgi:hypothetical protein